MDELRQRRIADNEARFRLLNETMQDKVDQMFGPLQGDEQYTLLCECAVEDCTSMLRLTRTEYEHLRSGATWFAVAPDHVVPDVEEPIERHEDWWIVAKRGVGAGIAKERDPRG